MKIISVVYAAHIIRINMIFNLGRPWPISLGSGFGLGFAISNCQHEFKRVDSLLQLKIPPKVCALSVCMSCDNWTIFSTD